ncbi:acyltransferase family protein [Globicatella sanguinis]
MQTVAYGLISAIGIRIKLVSNKKIFVSSFLFIFIYFIYALTLNFEYSYLYKYPPQNYYLAYALGVSFLLYSIFNKFSFRLNNMNNMNNLFIWISKNSFDIYLWHILALYLLKELEFNNQIFYNWFIQYIIILLFSFFMVVLSKKISIIKLS